MQYFEELFAHQSSIYLSKAPIGEVVPVILPGFGVEGSGRQTEAAPAAA